MPEANGMILGKDEENDAEVRREDQDKINEFGRLNARLHEVKSEAVKLKVRSIIVYDIVMLCHVIIYVMNV